MKLENNQLMLPLDKIYLKIILTEAPSASKSDSIDSDLCSLKRNSGQNFR